MTTKTKPGASPEPPRLDAVLTQMAEQRARLDAIDDRLGTAIRRIQEVLRKQLKLRVTHEISVDLAENDVDLLTFGKHQNEWLLSIESGCYDEDGDFVVRTVRGLESCSREVRAVMFSGGHLEALIRSAAGQIQTLIDRREQAISAAAGLLEYLGDEPVAKTSNTDDVPF